MNTSFLIPKHAKAIFIQGPQGKLDTLELMPNKIPVGVAIIFHPDPKGGGTYTNKIVQTIAKSLNQKGYICYCPNLRGVGLSQGIHDNGIGEVDDAMALHNFIRQSYPGLPLVLAGFSFGASIASLLAINVNYQKLILVGPAVTNYKVVISDTNKTLVIHGEEDEIISLNAVMEWIRKNNQPLILLPNTSHFFHGKLIYLQNLIEMLDLSQ